MDSHVAADIPDFRELGCFDLEKGRVREARQATGDLRLADAGGTGHQDILGVHLLAHIVRKLLAPPAVAKRDGNRALGIGLADDEAVEFGDDAAGREIGHGAALTLGWFRSEMLRLV